MEQWLLNGGYYLIFLLLAGGWLFCLLRESRSLVSEGREIFRDGKTLLLLISLLGLLLRLLAPRQLQIYYDELYYLSGGENLGAFFRAAYSWLVPGGETRFFPHFYPPYPPGWSACLSLWFKFFTPNLENARNLNLLFSALSIPAIFILSRQIWGNQAGALFAALLLALMPSAIKLAPSAAAEVSSFFWLIAAGIFLLHYFKIKSRNALYLAALTYALFLQMRPENLLTLPIFLALTLTALDGTALCLLLLGALPVLLIFGLSWPYPELRSNFLPTPRPQLAGLKAQIFSNLKSNLQFLFFSLKSSAVLILGAITALLYRKNLDPREQKIVLLLGGWFLLYFCFYLPYPFGDFNCRFSLDSWRSSLNLAVPLLLLFAGMIKALGKYPWGKIFSLVLLALILLNFTGQINFIFRPHPRFSEYSKLASLGDRLPRNASLIVENPDHALFFHYLSPLKTFLLKPQVKFPTGENTYLLTGNPELDFWKNYGITYEECIETPEQKLILFKVTDK